MLMIDPYEDKMWKEKQELEKLDPVPDEEFEPAREMKQEDKGEVLIHVDL